MKVRDAMTKFPVCCLPGTPIDTVARLMAEHDCGSIPVVGDLADRNPIGVITDRDIVVRSLAKGHDPATMVAGDCMTSPAATVSQDSTVHECVRLLEAARIRRAVVVDERGAVVGVIAQADIALHASKRETGDLVREVSKPNTPVFAL